MNSTEPNETTRERRLRRTEAAKYVVETYNPACASELPAKLAWAGSNGPPFRLAGRYPIYPGPGLDAWAPGKIGLLLRSTAEARARGEGDAA
jgi:hypothetical protein